ncbi:MAG: hypothetical protein Q8L48_19340 [Archangium sp.]|nr:hypothetical protein [Archangium sp.]
MRYVDRNGREFVDPTPAERAAIDALELIPGIGDRVRYFDKSPDIQITLNGKAKPPHGALTSYWAGRPGGGCQGPTPARALVEYNLKDSQDILRLHFGLESTLANILGHEFGHLDYFHDVAWGKDPPYQYDQHASDARSTGWEDLTRHGQYRRIHEPP